MNGKALNSAPSDWERKSIANVCKNISSGGTPSRRKPDYFSNGTIPWIKTQELNDWFIYETEEKISELAVKESAAKVLPKNTLLIAMYGATVGQLGILSKPMACNQACCALCVDENAVDFRYLFYQLLFHKDQFKNLAVGAAQQNLNTIVIKNFVLPFPPLAEQRAIADVLSALDDKIELNRRMNQTLEELAQTLFKHMFTDNPDRAGWEDGVLGEVIDIYDSIRVPLSSLERAKRKGKFPYYGAASVMDFVDDYLFDGVYLLVAEDGSVSDDLGNPTMQYVWGKFWVNNHAHILKGKKYHSTEFIYNFLKGIQISPYITGAVQPKLNQDNLKRIPIKIPPESLARDFTNKITPIYELLRHNFDENKVLIELRDTLLPRLMSGQVRVKS